MKVNENQDGYKSCYKHLCCWFCLKTRITSIRQQQLAIVDIMLSSIHVSLTPTFIFSRYNVCINANLSRQQERLQCYLQQTALYIPQIKKNVCKAKKRKSVSETCVHCYVKCATRWPHFFIFFFILFFLTLFLFLLIESIPGIFTETENDVHTMEIGK